MLGFHDVKRFYSFKKIVENLNLKFPIAEISRITGHSKSNVSKYVSGKLEPSDKFYLDFQKGFNVVVPKSDTNVSIKGANNISGSSNVSINNGNIGGGNKVNISNGVRDNVAEMDILKKQLMEKDSQIFEKDRQLAEKDRQIDKLLEIIGNSLK